MVSLRIISKPDESKFRIPKKKMENHLLEWATKNTSSSQRQTSVSNQPIDTKWLDIMMGKKDAIEMKSTIEKVMDIQTPDNEKVALLDYLENVNNIFS